MIVAMSCSDLATVIRTSRSSAYINGTVLGTHLQAARRQPWRLIGLEDAPPALDELAARLSEIDAELIRVNRERRLVSWVSLEWLAAEPRSTAFLAQPIGRAARLAGEFKNAEEQ